MINQQNNNIILLEPFNLKNETASYNAQHKSDSYIEITDNIKTFDQLIKSENFTQIKSQYIYFLNKLADLYYNFTGLQINSCSIIKLITDHTQYFAFDDLFYSYQTIRKKIYNIINYIIAKKNNSNDCMIAIICAKLIDCFEICLSGFNSKILRIHEYILFSSNLNITADINIKIRNTLENAIIDLLIEQQNSHNGEYLFLNVHNQNAIFNLVATEFNLDVIVDGNINLNYLTSYMIAKIIKKIYMKVSKFDICRIITDTLYDLLQNILEKTGASEWLDNYIINYNQETINDLEEYFLNEVNNYLGITHNNSAIKIQDIITLNEHSNQLYIANIKDKLHYLVALYLDYSPNSLKTFSYGCERLISLANGLTLFSVSRGYFYIIDNNQKEITLELNHLEEIKIADISIDVYIPILIQALYQTFTTKKINTFFYNQNVCNLLFNSKYSKYIIKAITEEVNNNENLRNRIVIALNEPHIQQGYIIKKDIFLQFINNNFLSSYLIINLLNNNIDLYSFVGNLNNIHFYSIINNLEEHSLHKLIASKKNMNILNKIKNIFYSLFKRKNWGLIIKLLNSSIGFELANCLGKTHKIKALKIVLNDKITKIVTFFLLDYIQFAITDKNNNNILHYFIENNDENTVSEIINKTNISLINKLLTTQNNKGMTALKFASISNNTKFFYILSSSINHYNLKTTDLSGNTILMSVILNNNKNNFCLVFASCNIEIINIKNNNKDTAVMLASKIGNIYFLQQIVEKHGIDILLATNKDGNNSLMIAIENSNHECVEYLLTKYKSSWLSHSNIQNKNPLQLAIMHNSLHLETIINKVNIKIINSKDIDGNNSIILASRYKLNAQIIESLLKYNNNKVLFERNNCGYSVAMYAAKTGNLSCLKTILKYANQDIFLQYNKSYCNSLMFAIKNNNHECVNFILDNSDNSILKLPDYDKKNALYLAIELNSKYVPKIIDKANKNIISAQCKNYYNSILLAAKLGYSHILTKLLEKCNTQCIFKKNYYDGYNAAMLASENGFLDCIKILLSFTNIKILEESSCRGYNSLMIAIQNRHNDCVAFLLKNSNYKILSQQNKYKENCLHLAIKNKSIYIKEIIKQADVAIIKATDYYFKTNLMLAAKLGDPEIVQLLLQKYNVNIINQSGNYSDNALMIAARNNNKDCIDILLKHYSRKVYIYSRNNIGDTAIDIAIKFGYLDCVKKLLDYSLEKAHLTKYDISNLIDFILVSYKYEHAECLAYLIEISNNQVLMKLFSIRNNYGDNLLDMATVNYKAACHYIKNEKNTTTLKNRTHIKSILENAFKKIS